MNQDKHSQLGLTRRKLFQKAGVVALGGLALSMGRSVQSFAHEGEAELEVRMGEMYFQVPGREKNAPIRLETGESHLIRFTNEGQVEHEVHFGRNPYQEGGLYEGYNESLFGSSDMGLHLKPGESAVLHVRISEDKKGEWEIGCFMPGHYEAGQKAPLIIE